MNGLTIQKEPLLLCIQRSVTWLECENVSWKFPCYWNNLAFCSPALIRALEPGPGHVTAPGQAGSSPISLHCLAWATPDNTIKKKNIKHHSDFSLKVSLDHWHVCPIAIHKSRLPFLLGTRVFFVFYWHSVKILRKNGKVAEPVRGGRPGPGGARLLAGAGAACAGPAVTCCMAPAWPRTGPGPRDQSWLPSVRPPPGLSSALARSGLPGLVKGTVQSQRKRETMNTVGFL